jgi:hypothetical protein
MSLRNPRNPPAFVRGNPLGKRTSHPCTLHDGDDALPVALYDTTPPIPRAERSSHNTVFHVVVIRSRLCSRRADRQRLTRGALGHLWPRTMQELCAERIDHIGQPNPWTLLRQSPQILSHFSGYTGL